MEVKVKANEDGGKVEGRRWMRKMDLIMGRKKKIIEEIKSVSRSRERYNEKETKEQKIER